MKKEADQVPLSKLVFTHNWEDPECDHAALKIKSNDSILAITSGGCNVLGFLLFDPGIIYSVDINEAQSFLMELKIAAIKWFGFEDFMAFAGLKKCEQRLDLYERIKPHLSSEAIAFWNGHYKFLARGFFMNGKYERFIRVAGKFLNLLQGRKRVMGLFDKKNLEEQQIYFDRVWDTKRFHYIFKLLFNKRMLAKRGLVANYFHFDDGSTSFAESFYNRSRKAFRNIPVKGNYFLSLYLLGRYIDGDVPAYLKEENFGLIKSRVHRIKVITADAQGWIDSMPDHSIDCFALSNICELMSDNDTSRLFTAVCRTARSGARVIFRNLMIPREVPGILQDQIVKDEPLSRALYDNDRSFVYGKVAAYSIIKS